jgi:aminoglycoside phosphotransferase (APT) family kinase protein
VLTVRLNQRRDTGEIGSLPNGNDDDDVDARRWARTEVTKAYSAWHLFWPRPTSGAIALLGPGPSDWSDHYTGGANRVYLVKPSWQRESFREPGVSNENIRIRWLSAPTLPFLANTLSLVSVFLPDAVEHSTPQREDIEVPSRRWNPDMSELAVLCDEARRVLRPEGSIVLIAPNRFSRNHVFSRTALARAPRAIASELATVFRSPNREHRTFSASLKGYTSLLLRSGFSHTEAIGFLDAPEQTQLVVFGDRRKKWTPEPRTMRERVKRHEWFVPVFGIRSSANPSGPFSSWDRIVQQLCRFFGSQVVRFRRCQITGKNKAIFFATAGLQRFVLKVPLDERSRISETINWSFLELGQDHDVLKAPRAIHRANAEGFAYFVEEQIVGTSVDEIVDSENEAAAIDRVGDYIERIHSSIGLESRIFDTALIERFITRPIESLLAFVGASDRLDELSQWLVDGLKRTPVSLGLMHGDLSVSNVVLEGQDVAGVIDWADAVRDGLPALDVIGHLESRVRRARHINIGGALAAILKRQFPDPGIEIFLDRSLSKLQVTPEIYPHYVYLYWVHHMGLRAKEATTRPDLRLRQQIVDSIQRLTASGLPPN